MKKVLIGLIFVLGLASLGGVALFNKLSATKVSAENNNTKYCHLNSGQYAWSISDEHSGGFEYKGTCASGEGKKQCQSDWCNNNQPHDECSNIEGKQTEIPDGKIRGEDNTCIDKPVEDIFGCTDKNATNYNPEAIEQGDIICTYPNQEVREVTVETPLTQAGAPICQDGNILALPIAFQVVRQGDHATLTWFKTGGDKVNIYFKEVGQENWTHAVGDVPNVDPSNTFVVSNLIPSVGYIFAIEQHQGCAGGQLVQSVVVDGPAYTPVLFNFSYWQWSK